ncbi:hypothetical protein BH20CHL5_BH20CHL5_02090 [soil metagenome]
MQIVRDESGITVKARTYRLRLPAGRPFAVLEDEAGEPWAELALAWSAHRLDVLDETAAIGPLEVTGSTIRIPLVSAAWREKTLVIECRDDELRLGLDLEGDGALTDLHLLAGYSSADARYGSGWFPSERHFQTLFSPEPHGPERIVQSATGGAAIDIVGGQGPGRGHWFFTPAPFCFAFARQAPPADRYELPAGPWLAAGLLTRPGEHGFTSFAYEAAEDTWSLRLGYEGKTRVSGTWRSPRLLLVPGQADPYAALARHRQTLLEDGLLPSAAAATPRERPDWWSEPIFCGWGAQVQLAGQSESRGPDMCTQDRYDAFMDTLDAAAVMPGTVVIDDKWQRAYGHGQVDQERWPDLRGWIAERHARGQRVLLWWKAWDPEGLAATWCVTNTAGRAVTADPSHPAYEAHLRAQLALMLGSDGYDADGLKIDFTAQSPSGPGLRAHGSEWGVELLHHLLEILYQGSKAAKADALIVAHAPNPYFADVADMVRLNDMLRLERIQQGTDVVRQMRHRARVAAEACTELLIDTDDWQVPDRSAWRAYAALQPSLGVPCLYYTDHVGVSGEPLDVDDYRLLRDTWSAYRLAKQSSNRSH